MAMTATQQIIAAVLTVFTLVISEASSAQSPINLGTAANYVIISKTTITTTGSTTIKGNLGLSPVAALGITGFSLTLSSDGTRATSPLVAGNVYAADYSAPTPATLAAAVLDMEAAHNEGSSRQNADFTNHGAGNINAETLTPGLYRWTTAVLAKGNIILSGKASDVFIFQVDGALTITANTNMVLHGGAKPENIFWVGGGAVTLAAGSSTKGIILGKTTVVFDTGASIVGRVLAQTAVTMIGNTVSEP